MKSKKVAGSSVRAFGQTSLPSSFLSKPLCGNPNKENEETRPSKKNSSISLTDFLNRKLNKNSSLPKKLQSKQTPFSTIAVTKGSAAGSGDECVRGTKRRVAEIDHHILGETFFKQLKHPRKENEGYESRCADGGGVESSKVIEQDLPNQANPFCVSSSKGGGERKTTSKYLVVLGDDPKPKDKWRNENRVGNNKERPFFNHYANGSGWWDSNMAGVDNDEVGSKEAWEGVGSTTLGGLEWH